MNGHDTERRDHDSLQQQVIAPDLEERSPAADGGDSSGQRAASTQFERLRQRSEFLAVAKGVRVHDAAFTVQAIRRDAAQEAASVPRFGLTVTKKTGNSVVRNRIRRRLREMLRHTPASGPEALSDGGSFDYVIVARREALTRSFDDLARDLGRSLKRARGRLAQNSKTVPVSQNTRQTSPDRRLLQTDEKSGPTS